MPDIIKIKDVCGEFCIDENDIQNLNNLIYQNLIDKKEIILDFTDVDTVLSAFFNGLLSELFKTFKYNEIQNFVKFSKNTSPSINDKFNKSLENAKKFFDLSEKDQKRIREKVNQIFRQEINLNESPHSVC